MMFAGRFLRNGRRTRKPFKNAKTAECVHVCAWCVCVCVGGGGGGPAILRERQCA
jgi:hypothetical protein